MTDERTERPDFDAFLSYTRIPDAVLAAAVRDGLHHLARPWYRLRAMRVFRDESSLAASPGLGPSIERALLASRYLIVFASPQAAESPWVSREIRFWLDHKTPEGMLLVVTDGRLVWDESRGDFDGGRSTALPPILLGAFRHEPLHVDLTWARQEAQMDLRNPRFRQSIVQLAAAVHGRDPDEIDGDDVRQHRKTRRVVTAVIAALSLLFVSTTVAAVIAAVRTAEALDNLRDASVRRLIAEADLLRGSDPETALRMDLAAYALAPEGGTVRDEATGALTAATLNSGLPTPIPAHQGRVTAVAFAPSGDTVATGGADSAVHLWDVRDPAMPRRVATLHGHRGDVTSLTFAGRDSTLVAADEQGQIVIWDTREARQKAGLREPGAVNSVSFGARTAILAAGGSGGRATLWDLHDPKRPRRLAVLGGRGETILALAFSPDEKLLATASVDMAVRLWDLTRPEHPHLAATIRQEPLIPRKVAFSPDGRSLAITGALRLPVGVDPVTIWDVSVKARPRLVGRSGMLTNSVDQVAFSPDGQRMVTGGSGGSAVVVWAGTVRQSVLPFPTAVTELCFAPDGGLLAVGGDDGAVRLVVLTDTAAPRPRLEIPGDWHHVAVSSTGSSLATNLGEEVHVWDPRRLPRKLGMVRPDGYTAALALNADGSLLAVVTQDDGNNLTLWDVHDPAAPRRASGLPLRASREPAQSSIAFHPHANVLAVTEESGTVTLWDVSDVARPRRLAALPGTQSSEVVLDTAGGLLATWGSEGPMSLWDVTDPAAPRRIDVPIGKPPLAVAFGGRGARRLLAVSLPGNQVAVWSLSDPRRPTRTALLSTPNTVDALSFNPRGDVLVVGTEAIRWRSRRYTELPTAVDPWGRDESALFYVVSDPATPRRVPTLTGSRHMFPPHLFTPDGRSLVTGSSDGLMLWNAEALDGVLAHPRERGCAIAGRALSPGEWTQHVSGLAYRSGCSPS
ncbi:TIR domain-containing protein [Sphaerisporangium album]|uniref:TIR domain-containing protein n=1 Tax=Sphaerisporangium album TaxID=509200 RepID=A0A367F6D6_9ACTN|nr:TIR domain-containing protein [Sphaerisporangium album]